MPRSQEVVFPETIDILCYTKKINSVIRMTLIPDNEEFCTEK